MPIRSIHDDTLLLLLLLVSGRRRPTPQYYADDQHDDAPNREHNFRDGRSGFSVKLGFAFEEVGVFFYLTFYVGGSSCSLKYLTGERRKGYMAPSVFYMIIDEPFNDSGLPCRPIERIERGFAFRLAGMNCCSIAWACHALPMNEKKVRVFLGDGHLAFIRGKWASLLRGDVT